MANVDMKMDLESLRRLIQQTPALRRLRQWAEHEFQAASRKDPGHDLSHSMRVALWAVQLGEGAFRPAAAVAAALLHDLVNPPKNSPERAKASELSAERARGILPEFGFPPEEVTDICDAIRTHSFSRGEEPKSALGRALQDADRLEALGAIGLFRVISTGVLLNAELVHEQDPWARTRPLDDSKYSVDHFFTKLLKLPETMKTQAGKAEACKRAELLKQYLVHLAEELGVPYERH